MTVYQILCLIGVPSILTGIVGYFVKVIKGIIVDQQELKKGVQALLKAEMIRDYNDYSAKGYSPIYAKENFETMYTSYHTLGGNGTMQELYANFLELPTEPKTNE